MQADKYQQSFWTPNEANNRLQIFNDIHIIRNKIKMVLKFIHSGYNLFSTTANSDNEQLTVVRNKADHLLLTLLYLCEESNAQVFQSIFRNCYALM
jgi:hypothetical protein